MVSAGVVSAGVVSAGVVSVGGGYSSEQQKKKTQCNSVLVIRTVRVCQLGIGVL